MPFTSTPLRAPETPVAPDEVLRPTRVVWRHAENRRITSRVFPTEARAYNFAVDLTDIIVVQDARERPPPQDSKVNKRFVTYGSGLRCITAGERR